MTRVLGRSLVFALLLGCALPARAADPIVMFILGIARDMAIDYLAKLPPDKEPDRPVYAGTNIQHDTLRRLVDDSFLHLTEYQRNEVFEALHAELLKPSNTAFRGQIIEFFAERALAVRAAHLRLAQLSPEEMRRLAAEFRRETRALPEEELEKLREQLQKGLLPVPPDLNRLLLAALN